LLHQTLDTLGGRSIVTRGDFNHHELHGFGLERFGIAWRSAIHRSLPSSDWQDAIVNSAADKGLEL